MNKPKGYGNCKALCAQFGLVGRPGYADMAIALFRAYRTGLTEKPSNTQIQTDGLIEHCKKSAGIVKNYPKFKRDCLGGHR